MSVLLTARRSAVNASTEAQLQLFSLVVAAPEPIRLRFRGQKLAAMLNTAAKVRVQSAWDVETTSTVVALRTLARRAHAMQQEARELQKAILGHHPGGWRPDLLEEFGVGPIVAATVLCASVPPRPGPLRGRVRDARRRSTHPREQRPGHHPVPAQPLRRPTAQQGTTHRGPDPNQYQPTTRDYVARRTAKGKTSPRSNAALPATSHPTSTGYLKVGPQLLDEA